MDAETSMGGKVAQRGARKAYGPTEKVFTQQVMDYARLMGWSAYHSWISIRSEPGFPDLVAVRAGRLVVAELKTLTGKLTPAQEKWLGVWGGIPSAEVFVWRPNDESWAQIERVLR